MCDSSGLPNCLMRFRTGLPRLRCRPMLILICISAGLCGSGHVHGCDRDAAADAACGLSCRDGAERRRKRPRRGQCVRNVGTNVCDLVWHSGGQNGRVLPDHPAYRPELLCCGRGARRPDSSGCVQRGHTVLHRGCLYHCALLVAFPGIVLWLPSLVG